MTDKPDQSPFRTGGGLDALQDIDRTRLDSMDGRVLGDYRITGLIAEGGMGRVYRAERVDGSFEREVAIKVSAVSGVSNKMRERFQIEQGLLASLDHANIAQLFDAQTTEEGWPYFVMEYVDGGPVNEYCADNNMSVDDRVRLFIDIVDAVAYAHSRLVVHRDLKPSNVLVTSDGRAKLLDFGIAKLLESDDAKLSRVVPLTPRYASPEQLLGQPVTIASDIFQLGHLLHEVLLGRPLSKDDTLAEAIARASHEQEIPVDAEARSALPRELVLIIEHCLRHTADDRYLSAIELKTDLQAWLDGYPVRAAGQGAGYRLRKFVVRHLAATALTAALAATIVAGGIAYTISISEARLAAEQERDEADKQRSIADESLRFVTRILNQADPNIAQGREITVREAIDASVKRIDEDYADRPEVQARIYGTLAQTYYSRGNIEKHAELAKAAEEAARKAYGENSLELFRARQRLGAALVDQGKYKEANKLFEELVERIESTYGPTIKEYFEARSGLAVSYYYLGDYARYGAINEESFAQQQAAFGDENLITIDYAYNVVAFMLSEGRFEEALELSSKYFEIAERVLGPGHQTTMRMLYILGNAHGYSGNLEEELRIRQDTMARVLKTFGENHREVALAKQGLAAVLEELGRYSEVEPLLASAAEIRNEVFGPDNAEALFAQMNLAVFQARYDINDEARDDLDRIIATMVEKIGPEQQYTAMARMYRAELLLLKKVPGADQVVEEELAMAERVLGPNYPELLRVRDSIAAIRAERGP